MIRTLTVALVLLIASLGLACTTTTEAEPAVETVVETPVVEPVPAPPAAPAPEPVAAPVIQVAEPAQLPKTGSAMPLVGLVGLGAIGLGGTLRMARRLRRR